MGFLRKWWNIYQALCFVEQYGPDHASIISRNTSTDDQFEVALMRWGDEGMTLLPHRYNFLLGYFFEARRISKESYENAKYNAVPTIWQAPVFEGVEGGVGVVKHPIYPWLEDPAILADLPDRFKKRVAEFEKDCDIFRSYADIVFVIDAYMLRKTLKAVD